MYLIHCECSRLCWVRTLSSSSAGCLSCLVVRPSHRCCHCCRCHHCCCCCCCCCHRRRHPWDICPVEASSPSSSSRGVVIRPPCHHHHPWAVCPAEATLSSSSSGPRRLSPTLSSSSAGHLPCKGLVAVIVQWGLHRPSLTILIVIIIIWWGPCHLSPTSSSSSSAGHLSCGGLVAVVIRWGCLLIGPH